MMTILQKILMVGGALAAPLLRGWPSGNTPTKRVTGSPVKFSTAPRECSEDEHQRRNQAAVEKRERKAAKLRERA